MKSIYFMMRQKLLHRMNEVCTATSHMMKDKLILGEHQVDGTRILIYIYIYLYMMLLFFSILTSPVRCYCILYLLSFIVTIIVSIIVHTLLLNSFLYLRIQLHDITLSTSLLHVHWILCCRIENISSMVYKANESKDLCAV